MTACPYTKLLMEKKVHSFDAFWTYIIELCSQTDWDIYESVPPWQLVQLYLIWIVHFVFCREIDILMPGYTHLQVGDSF